jgi:glycogen operon protein
MEYHIDGFKINSNVAPSVMIATDPILCDTKFLTESWKVDTIYSKEFKPANKTLAEINEGFANDVRRFLKGDEEQLGNFVYRFKRNDEKNAVINYVTNQNGFTLNDVYSYDVKHNEENGEMNRDGSNYNYSWNCGVEGATRKTKILALRKKMMKNAMAAMLLSQGTPMILAGDEVCHTQEGNNNAYCQDNHISWINWSMTKVKKEMLDFVKEVIELRKKHPVLHLDNEFKLMDYISCGYPDMSYHGTKAWYPDFSNYSRVLGILISGDYAVPFPNNPETMSLAERYKKTRKEKDSYFYLAYNMHWEKHDYELPRLPKGYVWKVVIDTSKDDNKNQKVDRVLTVDDRSIVVLEGCRDTENAKAVIIKNKVREGDSAKTTKVIKKVGTTKKKTMVSKTIKTTKEEKASKAVKTKRISKNNGKV